MGLVVWLLQRLLELLEHLARSTRRLFACYGPLPVHTKTVHTTNNPNETSSVTHVDARMPASVKQAIQIANAVSLPPHILIGSATAAYQVEGGLHHSNWSAWENRKTRHDGTETITDH